MLLRRSDSAKLTVLGEVLHYIPHNYWDSIFAQSLLLEFQKTHTKHLWTGRVSLLAQWKHTYLFHVLLQSDSRLALLKGAEGKKNALVTFAAEGCVVTKQAHPSKLAFMLQHKGLAPLSFNPQEKNLCEVGK